MTDEFIEKLKSEHGEKVNIEDLQIGRDMYLKQIFFCLKDGALKSYFDMVSGKYKKVFENLINDIKLFLVKDDIQYVTEVERNIDFIRHDSEALKVPKFIEELFIEDFYEFAYRNYEPTLFEENKGFSIIEPFLLELTF